MPGYCSKCHIEISDIETVRCMKGLCFTCFTNLMSEPGESITKYENPLISRIEALEKDYLFLEAGLEKLTGAVEKVGIDLPPYIIKTEERLEALEKDKEIASVERQMIRIDLAEIKRDVEELIKE